MLRLTTFFSYDASSALGPHRRHRHLQMISAFRKACLKILSCRSKNTPLKNKWHNSGWCALHVFPGGLWGRRHAFLQGCCCIYQLDHQWFLGGHSRSRAILGSYENSYLDMRVSLLPSVKNQSLSLQSQEPPCPELLQFLPWTCRKRSSTMHDTTFGNLSSVFHPT